MGIRLVAVLIFCEQDAIKPVYMLYSGCICCEMRLFLYRDGYKLPIMATTMQDIPTAGAG